MLDKQDIERALEMAGLNDDAKITPKLLRESIANALFYVLNGIPSASMSEREFRQRMEEAFRRTY